MRAPRVLLLAALSIPVVLGAQAPARSPKGPGSASAAQTAERDAPPAAYTYDPGGRRDPFMDLIGAGAEPRLATRKGGDGPAGLTVGDISVRGILQSRKGLVAMVQAPDNKTYLIHPGDKFADGTVKSITAQGLVIVQEVNDPLSLIKQREIRKQLRSAEGAKP